jgi:hypothetical protein
VKQVCNVNIVYGNLKSENSQDSAQKPRRNSTFMNSASGNIKRNEFCGRQPATNVERIHEARSPAGALTWSKYLMSLPAPHMQLGR